MIFRKSKSTLSLLIFLRKKVFLTFDVVPVPPINPVKIEFIGSIDIKITSVRHFLLVFFKVEESALFPKTKPSAPNKIDLPAPVSPVMIESPEEKSMCSSLINA